MMSLSSRTHLALWLAVVLATGVALIEAGRYGWTLFVIVPFALGLFSACIARPASSARAAAAGASAVLAGSLVLLICAFEGAICIAMSLPIVLPIGCAGALTGFWLQKSNLRPQAGAAMLVLPITALAWDVTAPPELFSVTTEVVVRATPEQVWKRVVSFPRLRGKPDWVFQTGLAYPTEARISGRGPGAVRYCQFSTGTFVEPITVWDEPHLLRFVVAQNPAPLREWSPWGEIRPKHLRGYLASEQGQFELTALAGGRTALTGTTWYRHGLWPAEYWRWWSDEIIHRIHLRVLNHVRSLAEQDARH